MVDSGVYEYESPAGFWVETMARLAYTCARVPMADPPGTGDLLDRLACTVRYVRVGVAAGDAEIVIGTPPGAACDICQYAHLLEDQSPEMLSIACARACAKYVAWVSNEDFARVERLLRPVTLAIAMPETSFRREMVEMSVPELARAYVVRPEHVLERMRMIRGAHDSTERPAFTSAAT